MVEMDDAMAFEMEWEALEVLQVVVQQVLQNVEFVRCKNQLKDSMNKRV